MTETAQRPPVTGAWREGDPAGRRQWFVGRRGRSRSNPARALARYRLAYETWGTLPRTASNAVLSSTRSPATATWPAPPAPATRARVGGTA